MLRETLQQCALRNRSALLLLGCGDIRNILFTAYSGAGIGR
jgi:hypothetical protein